MSHPDKVMSILGAALWYRELGFSLFPVQPKSKLPAFEVLPKNNGTANWRPFTEAPPTQKQIIHWFRPHLLDEPYNIALVMGEVSGNRVCIDFDDFEAYAKWRDGNSHYSKTATAKTSRGHHVLFIMPRPLPKNTLVFLDDEQVGEVRSSGSYIVAWPSIHPSGTRYSWSKPPTVKNLLTLNHLADAGLYTQKPTIDQYIKQIHPDIANGYGMHPLPQRTLNFLATGTFVGRGVNDELFNAAIQYAAAGYSYDETLDAILPAAEKYYVGTGNGNTLRQAARTIESGYKHGSNKSPISIAGSALKPLPQPPDQPLAPQPQAKNGSTPQTETPPENDNGYIPQTEPEKDEAVLRPKYFLKDGNMIYLTYKKDGDTFTPIPHVIPFWGRVAEKMTVYLDDGTQAVTYRIVGQKDGRRYKLDVEAADFSDGKKLFTRLLDYLPGGPPVIETKLISHVSTAISTISNKKEIKEMKALPHTGWTPDGNAFVMPGRGIGEDNFICKLSADLTREFSHFGFRDNTQEENQQALDALMRLFEVYRIEVIHVTIAHAFLPPLLRWLGNEARYMLHIHADTGSFKTELVKLIMSLYGPVGDQAITYKWSSTAYGAEARAHVLKDCLMLIDDLKPSTITADMLPKWVAFIQAAVDAKERGRASITGKAQAGLPPRAILISTGEAVPEAGESSYNARMLLAQLYEQPPGRNQVLDDVKNKSHLFSGLMGAYVSWLRDRKGAEVLETFKHYQGGVLEAAHTRLRNNYAANCTAGVMFARFCEQAGLMTETKKDCFIAGLHRSIKEIVKSTGDKVKNERYSQKFISSLRDAISTGWAYISDVKSEARRVGWQEKDYIYIHNGALSIVNQWLRMSGDASINISTKELRKQLHQDGWTYSTEARIIAGRYDMQRADPADGSRLYVIALHRGKFYSTEIEDSDQPV